MTTYTVTPLLVGLRSADQGMMTYQSDYGRQIWLPMWAFLLQGGGDNILVDTGLDDFMVPPRFTEETGLNPLFMEEALAEIGLAPDDIHMVINTHLHDDHCGNNPLFINATFFIQKAEIDICRAPHPVDDRYDESFLQDITIIACDGDFSPAEGVECVFTPGHTPGCQTVRIATTAGPVIIPGFCCNAKNFPKNGNAVCPGVHSDAFQAYDSAQRVQAMAGKILPLHEVTVPDLLSS
ncbi:MAG: N-acyl homoserine lactonase family protein [Desulfovibrionales bacterium]